MKIETSSHYYVYIITNDSRSSLVTDVSGDLMLRMYEYEREWRTIDNAAHSENFCRHLVWWEHFQEAHEAMSRMEKIKALSKKSRHQLIATTNPDWEFLNAHLQTRTQLYL